MSNFLVGTGIALATPFNTDRTIDFDGLTRLVNHCIEGNVEYLVVLGTTAESVTLSKEEKKQITDHIIKVNNKRLPLVIGVGGNNTQEILDQIAEVDVENFQAILSVVPMYNKPSQQGIFQHYTALADNAKLPILLYNVPSRTGVNMTAETTLRLAQHDNIIGIKEATDNIAQVLEIIKSAPVGFKVVSGDDLLALSLVTAGGHGVISVVGQAFPEDFSESIRLGLESKNTEAYTGMYKLTDAIDYAFQEGNPVGIKALLKAQNICESVVRLPLVQASEELENKIQAFIEQY